MSDTPVTPISERIRQALDGTTPGPWASTQDTDDHFVYQPNGRGPGRSRAVGTALERADAALIAAAPTLLTEAAAEIDRQAQVIAERDATIAELRERVHVATDACNANLQALGRAERTIAETERTIAELRARTEAATLPAGKWREVPM